MNRICILQLAVCFSFLTGVVLAQDSSRVELSAGYSYARQGLFTGSTPGSIPRINSNGLNAGVVVFLSPRVGIAGEIGWQYLSGNPGFSNSPKLEWQRHTFSYLFGPHVRLVNRGRVVVSARTLMGVARGEFQQYMSLPDPIGCYPVGYWETSFGAAFGGSFDITLSDHFAWRVVQPDLYLTRFTHATQKDFRISTGLVFRFGGR